MNTDSVPAGTSGKPEDSQKTVEVLTNGDKVHLVGRYEENEPFRGKSIPDTAHSRCGLWMGSEEGVEYMTRDKVNCQKCREYLEVSSGE